MECLEALSEKVTAVAFLYPPSEGVDGVLEGNGDEAERATVEHRALDRHRMHANVSRPVENRRRTQPLDIFGAGCREVQVDRTLVLIEGEASQHPGETEAVVAVQVGDTIADDETPARSN